MHYRSTRAGHFVVETVMLGPGQYRTSLLNDDVRVFALEVQEYERAVDNHDSLVAEYSVMDES